MATGIGKVVKSGVYMIQCYDCDDELIWGGDHDNEDIEGGIISNYNCSECDCTAIIYWNNKGNNNES